MPVTQQFNLREEGFMVILDSFNHIKTIIMLPKSRRSGTRLLNGVYRKVCNSILLGNACFAACPGSEEVVLKIIGCKRLAGAIPVCSVLNLSHRFIPLNSYQRDESLC